MAESGTSIMNASEQAPTRLGSRIPFFRFDALKILGKLGLRTLGVKLFVAVLALTGLSIALACGVAYLSFARAIESSEQLERVAGSVADAVDLFLSENIQFAKSLASDEFLIDAAEREAREAEKLGINREPDAQQIDVLENRYKDTHVFKVDQSINEFLREK